MIELTKIIGMILLIAMQVNEIELAAIALHPNSLLRQPQPKAIDELVYNKGILLLIAFT
jgi:hypothetical protein